MTQDSKHPSNKDSGTKDNATPDHNSEKANTGIKVRRWIWWICVATLLLFLAQYIEGFQRNLLVPSLVIVLLAFAASARAFYIQFTNNHGTGLEAHLRSASIVLLGLCVCGFLFWFNVLRCRNTRIVQFDSRLVHTPSDPPYPPTTTIGGVQFSKGMADVRFYVTPKEVSIQNLDFQIGLDHKLTSTCIFDIGQIGQYSDVKLFPPQQAMTAIGIVDEHGSNQTIVLDPGTKGAFEVGKSFGPVWRIQCAEVLHDTTLQLVLMAGQPLSFESKADLKWIPTSIDAWGSFDSRENDGSVHNHPFHIRMRLTPPHSN